MAPPVLTPKNIGIIETFVASLDKITGVFEKSYNGGDFCIGITLGYYGINMLQ